LILLAALAVSACGGGTSGSAPAPAPTLFPAPTPTPLPSPAPTPTPPPGTPPTPAPASVERDVLPATTSAAITSNFNAHVAVNPDPAAVARGRLFVMLPGTGGLPRFYRLILRTGAARGFHTIGLTYPNDRAVDDLCGAGATANCSGDTRREIITGSDASPAVAVDPANSISGRLLALLGWLHSSYPNEGWNRFVRAGAPDWSLITIAGHSQGAGHAAYMGKLHEFDRVALFAGPGDVGPAAGTPAAWFDLPAITPAGRQYGFGHSADELVPFVFLQLNWSRLGLAAFGAPVSVDSAAPPYGNSRQLVTSLPPAFAPTVTAPAHSAMVLDAVTPLAADGTPLFRSVWTHMAFP